MIKQALPLAAVLNPAGAANSGLDLERWPRWMREAFASQPEAAAPASPETVAAPARVDAASVRKLTRIPSGS